MRLLTEVLLILEMPFPRRLGWSSCGFFVCRVWPHRTCCCRFSLTLSSPQPAVDLSCVVHLINAAEPIDTTSLDAFEVRASFLLTRLQLATDFPFLCGVVCCFHLLPRYITSRCVQHNAYQIVVTVPFTLGSLLLDNLLR